VARLSLFAVLGERRRDEQRDGRQRDERRDKQHRAWRVASPPALAARRALAARPPSPP
jgi:hypothetical protein